MTPITPENSKNDDESAAVPELVSDLRAERVILDRAIGGWRGLFDSGAPTLVFVTFYVINPESLTSAIVAALITGLIIVLIRVVRKDSLQQIMAGFFGLAIAAIFSVWTGRAENFFLPGLLTNLGYGSVFLISILLRWPLLGVILGYWTGNGTAWRADPSIRRATAAASWIWVGLFFGRLIVQVPFYLSASVETLGVLKIVMGWPLFLAAAYFTYRILAPVYTSLKESTPDSRNDA